MSEMEAKEDEIKTKETEQDSVDTSDTVLSPKSVPNDVNSAKSGANNSYFSASSTFTSFASAAKTKLSQSSKLIMSPLPSFTPSTATGYLKSSTFFTSQGSSDMETEDTSRKSMSFESLQEEIPGDGTNIDELSEKQRATVLENLVQSRRNDWFYLKAMHEGTSYPYWLNIALIREKELLNQIGEKQLQRRCQQLFYLGLSIGDILQREVHAGKTQHIAMAGAQLFEEFDYYFASATVQSMKLMVATSSRLYTQDHVDTSRPFRPTLYKWNKRPVIRQLQTPPIPFQLDYREVVISLCELLHLFYGKIIADPQSSDNEYCFRSVLRFDEKLKRLILDPIKKELTEVALKVVKDEISSVRNKYSSKQTAVSRLFE